MCFECSRGGRIDRGGLRPGLLLDENGARIPMGAFGLDAKYLARNARHEHESHTAQST